LSYAIGLWFTLRTHAAVIWNNEADEKKSHGTETIQAIGSHHAAGGTIHGRLQRQGTSNSSDATRGQEIRDSQLYKRILGQSLKQVGLSPRNEDQHRQPLKSDTGANDTATTPHLVPPKSSGSDMYVPDVHIPGFSDAENNNLVHEVAELAATAATIAAQDATRTIRKGSVGSRSHPNTSLEARHSVARTGAIPNIAVAEGDVPPAEAGQSGGHDAPNWSRTKSSVVLMGATILYALIAEILVNTVDVVLTGVAIDEKFLGITLFALVPNTTEFLVSQYPSQEVLSD
jgi:Ca2+:H+ antiporter